jgi:hypothetical protein
MKLKSMVAETPLEHDEEQQKKVDQMVEWLNKCLKKFPDYKMLSVGHLHKEIQKRVKNGFQVQITNGEKNDFFCFERCTSQKAVNRELALAIVLLELGAKAK